MTKLFEGTVITRHEGGVLLEMLDGKRITVKAGDQVQAQAENLIGKRVRFQAMLHESTPCLASPIFVVGSQFGLQAVR